MRTRTRRSVQLPAPCLNENYKEVPEFPGYYVNEHGQVFELRGNQLDLLRVYRNAKGDLSFILNETRRSPHMLVLRAFKPLAPFQTAYCKHLDGDKTNNKLSNLEWVATASEAGFCKHLCRLNETAVHQICKLLASRTRSTQSLANEFGVDASTIRGIQHGRNWRHIAKEYFHVIE